MIKMGELKLDSRRATGPVPKHQTEAVALKSAEISPKNSYRTLDTLRAPNDSTVTVKDGSLPKDYKLIGSMVYSRGSALSLKRAESKLPEGYDMSNKEIVFVPTSYLGAIITRQELHPINGHLEERYRVNDYSDNQNTLLAFVRNKVSKDS